MVIGLAGRRKGKSLCVAYSANLNPDSRIAELISSEPQAVLIPRNLPAEKSGRSVGPLFSRSATHVGKVPQSCLRELLQGFRARPFRRSRKLHFIQTIRRFGRHVYLWEGKGHKLGGGDPYVGLPAACRRRLRDSLLARAGGSRRQFRERRRRRIGHVARMTPRRSPVEVRR